VFRRGGVVREIDVKEWPTLGYIAWLPDKEGFIGVFRSSRGGTILWIDGQGRASKLHYSGHNIFAPAVSPDGRYLAFGHSSWDGNVWLVEGF
jgi:Tol biopolymer transport system component